MPSDAYNPAAIEPKWQKYWEKQGIYRLHGREEKFYVLDMFPYPSGAGLHVGHPKGYIATDVAARMKQLQGYDVLHPMGWDAFGLPAEQYALKNRTHPAISTQKNIATYKRQLKMIGFTYDWEREINTTDPEYYRWTQWIFLQIWKKGLAYESHEPISWCPTCKTGLANEDLEHGRCERCGSEVEKRPLRQWVLRMTAYADRLLSDLDRDDLEWEDSIKDQQRHWIGRSEGSEIEFFITHTEKSVPVFTTRLDTIFGCTYIVVAPEHPLIREQAERIANFKAVEQYIRTAASKSDLERTELAKEKTGICLDGIEAVHPLTGRRLPVFVADYVLGSYGTGAVMGVPAHDERDFAFAQKYGLESITVIEPVTGKSQENPAHKEKIVALVEDGDGKVLTIDWGPKLGGRLLIGGTVEGDEDVIEAAKREIAEETGYIDLLLVDRAPERVHHEYFAHSKGKPYVAHTTLLRFKLLSAAQKPQAREDHETFSAEWIAKDEAAEEIVEVLHRYAFDRFLAPHPYTGDGILTASESFSGLTSEEARQKITAWLEKEGLGKKKVNYRMRDWTFSRQRYWGEPIPLIHCEKCGVVPVPEEQLPVTLPAVESYEPTDNGESPLASIASWVNVPCPACGGAGRRETNTMPQWAGSCWYYLRYIDPHNSTALVDKGLERQMMPVDLYVGGAEHATRHLLYARFWHKFLFDIGSVSTVEPFRRLVNVGLILASDGRKMSKRWGNVINPDEVVGEFGADAFRIYEMFMGPFTQSIPWNTDGVVGARRFLDRIWKLVNKIIAEKDALKNVTGSRRIHQTVKKVQEDIESFAFNTAVSELMSFYNERDFAPKIDEEGNFEGIEVDFEALERFIILLSPFAPHIAEELWSRLGHAESIFLSKWPAYDPSSLIAETVEIAVQVNGKVRGRITIAAEASSDEAKELALADPNVRAHTAGKEIRKVIYVPKRIVNLVI